MKKIEKDSDTFEIENTSPTHFSKLKNFLWVCWFLGKNLYDFVPQLENSKTRTTILIGKDKLYVKTSVKHE